MSETFFTLPYEQQIAHMQAAGAAALDHWGLGGAAMSLIKYRENAVFEIAANGQRFALRLHRPGYHSDDALRSELQWMAALSEAGIDVPEAVPTRDGALFIRQSGADLPGGSVQVDLFQWINGQQLGSSEEGIADVSAVARTYETLGELTARVHNQAAGWAVPQGFVRHAWDADGLAGNNPFWGRFWEVAAATAEQRALLEAVRDRLFADLSALDRSPDVYSMIHADFAPENIMVDGDTVRLIDFDDAGFGWHLFELVTSLYFIMDEPYFEDAQAALIRGYRRHRALPDSELEKLPLFFLARATTYVGWVHTREHTQTAQELTPMLIEGACALGSAYLGR